MGTSEVVSAAAAVVSAVGGVFAAMAAFRSADSAWVVQQAAATAEHRAALRQIGVTATEVLIEAERISSRGGDLKIAYRSLFVLAGQIGGSREALYDAKVNEKLNRASELSEYAKLFAGNTRKLDNAPPEETDRVHVHLSNAFTEIRALREDIEREIAGIEGQSATYRDKAIMEAMK